MLRNVFPSSSLTLLIFNSLLKVLLMGWITPKMLLCPLSHITEIYAAQLLLATCLSALKLVSLVYTVLQTCAPISAFTFYTFPEQLLWDVFRMVFLNFNTMLHQVIVIPLNHLLCCFGSTRTCLQTLFLADSLKTFMGQGFQQQTFLSETVSS